MAVTVVEEGEQVVLNCTQTQSRDVTFFGPTEVLQKFPPVNNVLTFPANLSYQGSYSCSYQFSAEVAARDTFLAVLPGNLSQLFFTFLHGRGRRWS